MLKIKTKNNQKVYFTSDLHLFHKNICRATTSWDDPTRNTRDFESVEQMSNHIIDSINNVVKDDDILILTGDFTFDGIDRLYEGRKCLKCKNLHLILGNHDHHVEKNSYIEKYGVYARELFTSVNHYLEVDIDGQMFVLCHYPIHSWNKQRKNSIHLHGHVHGEMNEYYLTNNKKNVLDVGIDSHYKLFNTYEPFEMKKIIQMFGR